MKHSGFVCYDWKSDVYLYEGTYGRWCTHISTRINTPHAGKRFTDLSASACADRLEMLRKLGHRIPQKTIDALRTIAGQRSDIEGD